MGRPWIARIVDRVNESEPDMVCIAGDIFDGNLDAVKDLAGAALELRRIKARNGVYACLGNHDVDRMRLFRNDAGTDRIADFLGEANILLLSDEAARISDTVYIAGRRDARPIGMRQSRISAAELAAKAGGETVLVMLDHQPIEFPQIEAAGADLLLCGHTHKGQIFPANLITRRIFAKAGATHYGHWQGKTMQAVVTSGAGVWGPPLRVGTNSEIAVIDIQFSGNEGNAE